MKTRFQVEVPQGLKPGLQRGCYGTAEAVPLQADSPQRLKPETSTDGICTAEAVLHPGSRSERKLPTQAAKRQPLEWGTRFIAAVGLMALMFATLAGAK